MAENLFEDTYVKLNRAKQHIKDFKEAQNQVLSDESFLRLSAIPNEDSATTRIAVHSIGTIPKELSCIFGDAVHCLRSSLDILVCSLGTHKGCREDKLSFPFCGKREHVDDAIKDKNIHKIGNFMEEIVRNSGIYKGSGTSIRIIHDLDVTDKHRRILFMSVWCGLPSAVLNFSEDYYVMREADHSIFDTLKVGLELDDSYPSNEIRFREELCLDLALADGEPGAGRRAWDILENGAKTIEQMIEECERTFFYD